MSLISGQINVHERHRSDRRSVRMHMESMWSDGAARRFLDVLDGLEQADRDYAQALNELDAMFDSAYKLFRPTP